MGSSEFYEAIDSHPDVVDSLVVEDGPGCDDGTPAAIRRAATRRRA